MNRAAVSAAAIISGADRLERALDLLARLVAFDTTSHLSNLPLIAWVEGYLDTYSVPHRRMYDASGTKANLWATIGPADVPGYILSGHTDVVPVEGQAWTGNPFRLTSRGGRHYGRGTADMKGFLACCLALVPEMAASPLVRPIHLAFSYDEEIGCVGVRGLIDELKLADVKPLGCIVGEPTSMQVVIGHKGKRSVRATVRGLNAHSSLAPMAVNAVEYLAAFVARVQAMGRDKAANGVRDELYDVPHSTAHVGLMRGGTALNIVPDQAEALFEVRAVGADDPDAMLAELMAYARDELEPLMQAVDPATGFDFDIYAGFPGLDISPEDPLVTLAKALAGRNDHAKVAYGTEAGLFQQEAGIPTIILGPGAIDQAHKADEWIADEQLVSCLAMLDGLVARCRE